MFIIKLNYRLSEVGHDSIIEWAKNILPKGNRLKKNFYAIKSMMESLSLEYQKNDMCPNLCMLSYDKNANLN